MLQRKRLAKVLVEKGIIENETLQKALKIQDTEPADKKRSLETILTDDLKISHDVIFGQLADLYAFRTLKINFERIDAKQIQHTKDILAKFPDDLKKDILLHNIVPYKILSNRRNTLLVLAANPLDKICEKISLQTEFKKYEVVYTPLKSITKLVDIVAPQQNVFLDILDEVGDEVGELKEEDLNQDLDEYSLDEEINKSLLVNLFEGCLIEAVRKGVSDVHIIPFGKNNVDIYFRIDGKLTLWHRQENITPEAMSAVVKDRSTGIDRFERGTAQDGFAQRNVDGHLIRFRISVIPIVSEEYERLFESIVIRVIDDRNVITDLRKLGIQDVAQKNFLKAINTTKGMVIVTGPTGSGKSTTLIAALYNVIDPTKNVLTVEDPVEFVIHGARQLKISGRMSFDSAIRSILRHDPDIVLVGEIRDKKTAEVGVKLANTGHLTFSTLHTNDAPSAISRLFKMGIEPFLLASSINIITAQRLIRKLCPKCKVPLSKSKYKAALEMGITEAELKSGKIYEAGKGCKKCNNGYKGRVNICEALYFSPEVKAAILASGADIDEDNIRKIAESQGMLSLRDSGVDRIVNGLSTLEEVSYATSED